jgi:hypothetical protein
MRSFQHVKNRWYGQTTVRMFAGVSILDELSNKSYLKRLNSTEWENVTL